MLPIYLNIIFIVSTLVAVAFAIGYNRTIQAIQKAIEKERKEMNQRAYETLILREIGEQIGYELNTEKILETIIGSLSKLVSFSAVSYLLVTPDPEKVVFRVHLNESVSHKFLDNVKDHLLFELNKITNRVYLPNALQEKMSGMITDDTDNKIISSLWLAPLKINNQGVGVLAIASPLPNLYQGTEMDILIKLLDQANHAVSQLEEVLHNEQSKILSMISSLVDGVVMLDNENNITAINPRASDILQIKTTYEITIRDVAMSLSDKIDLRAKIDDTRKSDSLFSLDNLNINNRYYKLIIAPAKDKSNRVIGAIVIFRDVTAEKELERLRDDFMAMMVHELRAPLGVIAGTTDMFLREPKMVEQSEGVGLLTSMKNSTATMLDLVNDLLDAAKIEAGKFQILPTRGDIAEIVRDRVTFFTQMANPKQVTISAVESPFPLVTQFDKERIVQVFNNLISNAIKFTPSGGRIIISAKPANSTADFLWRFNKEHLVPTNPDMKFPCIEVTISDTGMGIPPEQISNLFSKFKQISLNTQSGHKGTGLGLVIVKGIIQSHGGEIFVESQAGEGTTFHFTIPVVNVASQSPFSS